MFLHFHAFLQADSGMGSFLTPALTSRNNTTELPVVKITELNSIAAVFVQWEMKTSQATIVPNVSGVKAAGRAAVARADRRETAVRYLFATTETITLTCRGVSFTAIAQRGEGRVCQMI